MIEVAQSGTKVRRLGTLAGVLLLVGIPLAATAASLIYRTYTDHGDFQHIYRESRVAITQHLLTTKYPDSLGFYPPSARPLLMLEALLPLMPAAVLCFVIYAACHVTACYLTAREVCGLPRQEWLLGGLIMWLLSLLWIWTDLSVGNVTSILVISLVGSYALARRGWTWAAATVLSVGIVIKFLPAAALGYYLWKRRFKMVAATLLVSLLLGILPGLWFFGAHNFAEGWRDWAGDRMPTRNPVVAIRENMIFGYKNQSLAATLMRLFTETDDSQDWYHVTIARLSSRTIMILWALLVALPFVAWLLLVLRGPRDGPPMLEAVRYALFVLMMVWLSPLVRTYYLALLSLPAGVLGIWAYRLRRTGRPDRFLESMLVVYVALWGSVTSKWLWAVGAYQLMVLALGIAATVTAWRYAPRSRDAGENWLSDKSGASPTTFKMPGLLGQSGGS